MRQRTAINGMSTGDGAEIDAPGVADQPSLRARSAASRAAVASAAVPATWIKVSVPAIMSGTA